MSKKIECNKEIHPITPETIKKMSCSRLWKKMGCFARGIKVDLTNGQKHYIPIMPHFPNDPTTDTPIGRTFTDIINTIDERKCKVPKTFETD